MPFCLFLGSKSLHAMLQILVKTKCPRVRLKILLQQNHESVTGEPQMLAIITREMGRVLISNTCRSCHGPKLEIP